MLNPVPAGLPPRPSERAAEWRSGGILVFAFAVFATLSWRTWPDVIVDFGQELYVPWRLSEGEVLYRDIAWVSGPLSQYVNAVLFKLFGVSFTTLIVANLVLLGGIVAMLAAIFRMCGTRRSATGACLFFLAVFAFAQYSLIGNYNYICPYRHDITHGLALGLVNLLCLIRFRNTGRRRWLLGCGVVLGLLSLTKIEMTLATGLMLAVALPVFAWQRRGSARTNEVPFRVALSKTVVDVVRHSTLVLIGAFGPIAVCVSAFASVLGWREAFRQVFLQYILAFSSNLSSSTGFYRAVIGTDNITGNLLDILMMTFVIGGAIVAAFVADRTITAIRGSKPAPLRSLFFGLMAAGCGLWFGSQPMWHTLSITLPVMLVPILMIATWGALRGSDSDTVLLLAAAFGLGLLPKVLLHVSWAHYGFVLAMPGTLVVVHFLCHHLPALWHDLYRGSGQTFRALAAGMFTACAMSLAWSWIRIDIVKQAEVGVRGDRFYADAQSDERVPPTVNTLEFLRGVRKPGETLIVFPNGTMLNYQLRMRNPTPYLMFSPWESDVHGGEDKIADAVIRAAPDYAVLVTMDLTIHGRGNFGSPEFGGRIAEFLSHNYEVVFQDRAQGVGGIYASTVMKRRSQAK